MLRILIADDQPAFRRGLRRLIDSHPHLTCCGEAANGREAVEQALRLDPDVVLTDMWMPEINGIEVIGQIREAAPHIHAFLLTGDRSEDLIERAVRAGAEGAFLKSQSDELFARLEAITPTSIRIAGCRVGHARHIGVFVQSPGEFETVIAPFLAEGLSQGEKAVHIIDGKNRHAYERTLRKVGVDYESATSKNQFDVRTWDETYFADGAFNRDTMLAQVKQMLEERKENFPLARIVGHMEWALEERPGVWDLAKYEAEADRVLSQYDDVVACVYDLTRFSSTTIDDVMRSHPCVVIDGAMRENSLYVGLRD